MATRKGKKIVSNPFDVDMSDPNSTTFDNNDGWNNSAFDVQEDENKPFTNNNNNNNNNVQQNQQQQQNAFNVNNNNNNQNQKKGKKQVFTPFGGQADQSQSHNIFDNQGVNGMINMEEGANENQQFFDNNNQQSQQQQQRQPQFQQQGQQNWVNPNGDDYDYDNEPPLLEDLGINLELIKQRMIAVMKFQKCDEQFLSESDMSGPIILAFALGFFMLLQGKVHFGYIYGFGICGTLSLYLILNWLAQHKNIALYNVLSILGYGLLPIVILSLVSAILKLFGLNILVGIFAIIATGWATYSSSTFFEEVLALDHQKYLAGYPIFLFYFTFVLITIF